MAFVIKHGSGGALVETFTVTEDSCELTGAWKFEDFKNQDFKNIISDRVLITPKSELELKIDTKLTNSIYVDLDEFLTQAKLEAKDSVLIFEQYLRDNLAKYSEYMKIPPVKRRALPKVTKLKLEPFYFSNWNLRIDHISPSTNLENMKKRSEILGTPPEMLLLNQFAWLIKTLVEMWLQDEKERNARKKMSSRFESIRVLPDSWLNCFMELRESI